MTIRAQYKDLQVGSSRREGWESDVQKLRVIQIGVLEIIIRNFILHFKYTPFNYNRVYRLVSYTSIKGVARDTTALQQQALSHH